MTTPKAAGSAFLRVTIKTHDSRLVIDGEWYIPKWGCDSLEASLDALQAILQNDKLTYGWAKGNYERHAP
jgi:hypothetical protein